MNNSFAAEEIPNCVGLDRGVSSSKKDLIVQNLVPLMDEHKRKCWHQLKSGFTSKDLTEN